MLIRVAFFGSTVCWLLEGVAERGTQEAALVVQSGGGRRALLFRAQTGGILDAEIAQRASEAVGSQAIVDRGARKVRLPGTRGGRVAPRPFGGAGFGKVGAVRNTRGGRRVCLACLADCAARAWAETKTPATTTRSG